MVTNENKNSLVTVMWNTILLYNSLHTVLHGTQILHMVVKGKDRNVLNANTAGCFNLAPCVTTFTAENSHDIMSTAFQIFRLWELCFSS
jgi:hypothetical protein